MTPGCKGECEKFKLSWIRSNGSMEKQRLVYCKLCNVYMKYIIICPCCKLPTRKRSRHKRREVNRIE